MSDRITQSNQTGRGPSPDVWARLDMETLFNRLGDGYRFEDDFLNFGGTVATNVGTYSGYKSFEDTSCTLRSYSNNADRGGVVRASVTTSASKEVSFEAGYGYGGPFLITAGQGPILAFEARVRLGAVSTSAAIQNFFVGLAEPGLAVTDGLFADADTLGQKDLIGFRMASAAGVDNRSDTLKSCLGKNGAAERTSGQQSKVLTAATWYKVGFLYTPLDTVKLRWFIDGVLFDSITDDTIAQFPTAHDLTLLFAFKSGASGTAGYTADIDWWMCAQRNA